MSSTLTAEDLRLLQYFWQEKRDLSCWTGFKEALPRIEAGFPGLARAWRAMVVAPRMVTAVLYYLRDHSDERTVSRALTEDELSELWWAWTAREDLTYASWFTSRIPALELDYPELVKAWRDYQSAQEAMDKVMEQADRLYESLDD
ncbi:hypothetical protein WJ96_04300 [Burkholderia ubonensis]|uniref:Uncharacterized protein n=1 Tax=Burkholderia ubonensis TaxID=101571 RepID=A0AAW3N1C0_9BURK|nr:hypothetical protein [Burkholderia ubonensis]KVP97796.1 hypothetical protein WJ96_04300 [Burkholderia ubonensis]KVZ92493.1 hypothetical protein WL25_15955 [Burkholderia ubonensis]